MVRQKIYNIVVGGILCDGINVRKYNNLLQFNIS